MKNKEITKSKKMLHNEHVGKNKYGTLEIKQANFATLNFEFIGYNKIGIKNMLHEEKSIHFLKIT